MNVISTIIIVTIDKYNIRKGVQNMAQLTIKYLISIIVLFIVVYTIDSLFFRHLFWERLLANIIIVLVFILIFFKFIK